MVDHVNSYKEILAPTVLWTATGTGNEVKDFCACASAAFAVLLP